jgi:hydroxyacylglutathione hydrolase
MQIHRYFIAKSLDNFNHLVYCPITREAAVIDPFNMEMMDNELKKLDLTLTAIWLTHTHHDHIRAVNDIKNTYSVPVIARKKIDKIDIDQLFDLDKPLTLGQSHVSIIDTPGHYPDHVCFYNESRIDHTNTWLISGDTLLNAGIGHVRDGNIEQLFDSVSLLLANLPNHCKIYNGHNYLINNCKFTLSLQPDNQTALDLVTQFEGIEANSQPITTLNTEKEINLFMQAVLLNDEFLKDSRLNPSKAQKLTNIAGKTAKEKFISLRLLRDQW